MASEISENLQYFTFFNKKLKFHLEFAIISVNFAVQKS